MVERWPGSLVIITGMSGSGKHTAFKAFEDLGFFCVDNLPIPLVSRMLKLATASDGKIDKLAIVIDIRMSDVVGRLEQLFEEMRRLDVDSAVIFLDASDAVLVRRFSETRRVHPLARDTSVLEGVQEERERLFPLRAQADEVIDTSDFTVHDLRKRIYEQFQDPVQDGQFVLSLVSFGFKKGLPLHSDMVFDVRFLPNPYFEPGLRDKGGDTPQVRAYLEEFEETSQTLDRLEDMLEYLFPRYSREGKSYLTVSIGCTGGRHRSVMVAEALAARLRANGRRVNLIHRDLHSP